MSTYKLFDHSQDIFKHIWLYLTTNDCMTLLQVIPASQQTYYDYTLHHLRTVDRQRVIDDTEVNTFDDGSTPILRDKFVEQYILNVLFYDVQTDTNMHDDVLRHLDDHLSNDIQKRVNRRPHEASKFVYTHVLRVAAIFWYRIWRMNGIAEICDKVLECAETVSHTAWVAWVEIYCRASIYNLDWYCLPTARSIAEYTAVMEENVQYSIAEAENFDPNDEAEGEWSDYWDDE